MNKYIFILFLGFIHGYMIAQFEPLKYDWDGNFVGKEISPFLFMPDLYQFSFPALGNLNMKARHNGFTAYDLWNTQQTDFNQKVQQVTENLKSSDGFFFHLKNQWLAFGWKRYEYSFYAGISTENNLWFFHSPSIYRNLLSGVNVSSGPVQLNEINFRGEVLNRFTFGFGKAVSQFYQYGLNFHLYNVGMSVSSYGNKGKVYTKRTGDLYETHLENIRFNFRSAGLKAFFEKDQVGLSTVDELSAKKRLFRRLFLGGNLGLGLDYGLRKVLNKDWVLTFHLSDLGFVYYTTDLYSFRTKGDFTYTGVAAEFPDTTKDYWAEIKENLNNNIKTVEHNKPYIQLRPFKSYFSLKKYFGTSKNKIKKRLACYNPAREIETPNRYPFFGLMAYFQHLQGRPYTGAAFYGQWYPTSWLDLRVTYAFDSYVKNNLGLAMNLRILKWNLYLAADNLLSLRDLSKTNGFSLHFGSYFSF